MTSDNKTYPARLVAKDEINDVAILEIDADIKPLQFDDSENCKISDSVFTISTPISAYLKNTYAEGDITNLNIAGFSKQYLMQTNIALSPGSSGAPLFDSNYNVVGMISFKSTEFGAEGLGFAIPGNQLLEYIRILENGIELLDLKLEFKNDIYQKYGIPNQSGITIEDIGENSMAKGLLKPDDIIIRINDEQVVNIVTYYELMKKYNESSITFTIKRDGIETQIIIKD